MQLGQLFSLYITVWWFWHWHNGLFQKIIHTSCMEEIESTPLPLSRYLTTPPPPLLDICILNYPLLLYYSPNSIYFWLKFTNILLDNLSIHLTTIIAFHSSLNWSMLHQQNCLPSLSDHPLHGQQKFPLWGRYGSLLEQPDLSSMDH